MHCRQCARPPSSLWGPAPLLWFSTSTSIPSCTCASVWDCCTWACTLHAAACCSAFLLSWWSATVWSASCLLMRRILVIMKLVTNHSCLFSVIYTSVGLDSPCYLNKHLHACLVLPAKCCPCWWSLESRPEPHCSLCFSTAPKLKVCMKMLVQVYFGLVILCSYLKPLVRLLLLCMCHAK